MPTSSCSEMGLENCVWKMEDEIPWPQTRQHLDCWKAGKRKSHPLFSRCALTRPSTMPSHYNVLYTPYLIMLHTGCYEYCGLNELCFVHMNCLLLHTELGALDFKYLPA